MSACEPSCVLNSSISNCSTTVELEADFATRATTSSLLEIIAILLRGDVRSDVHKELDRQIEALQRFQSQPEVDARRLATLIASLAASRDELDHAGTNFLQPLKDCEFLSSIKHRSAIPGGTCEFDLLNTAIGCANPLRDARRT